MDNKTRGKQVRSIADLRTLASKRKSVVGFRPQNPDWPTPAAFMLRMQADRVDDALRGGLYEYKPRAENAKRHHGPKPCN